jgi:DNA modification methylase
MGMGMLALSPIRTPARQAERHGGLMTTVENDYERFLRAKMLSMPDMGIDISDEEINPILKPHQRSVVRWAVKRGRAAIFEAFGLGKTIQQLEIIRLLIKHLGGRGIVVCPLGVRGEFMRDAGLLRLSVQFVQSIEECADTGIFITNYETIRLGKLDPRQFTVVSLDEAAVLRGFGGVATFRKLMQLFEGSGIYRFVATATPSPNDFIELLAYAAFLDVMEVSAAKTRFFQRDSEHADQLTLLPQKEAEFWLFCSTWAVFLQSPADLGFDPAGYELPPITVRWHEIPSDHTTAGQEPNGQGRLLSNSAIGVSSAAREKRSSLHRRVAKLEEIIESTDKTLYGYDQFIVWADLDDEQRAVDKCIAKMGISFSSLYGKNNIDAREVLMDDWRAKRTVGFVSKSQMYGAGANLQQARHEVFIGINYKFYAFIQAIHRTYRFLQEREVIIDVIYTEAEREIRRALEEKWEKHKELIANMTEIIRQYGLGSNALIEQSGRKMVVERQEVKGEGWIMVNNDCIPETAQMDENSVDLILTSIPFSQQYEYSASFRDFGHNEDNEAFWQQMDFLIPNLLRVLKPGRVAAIHVKDRITPSGLTGRGYQTVYRFSDECGNRFDKHGFGFLGRKTIVTDVVRENNQTYRLGWTEQCKDGSRMGAGMPEYLMLFRKNPTDTSNGYADVPVVKLKAEYTRSRWQIDAHGFMRSNGDRYLEPRDLEGIPHERIFKLFRQDSMRHVYDFEKHVALSESLERCQECGHIHIGNRRCGQCECKIAGSRLPATFMLLQPQSWHPDVWTDVARMRTLNCNQVAKNREMHVCPMQLDIADRVIEQFSMKGEVVFDPFMGIGTVGVRAIKLGRKAIGCELSESYWKDACMYFKEAEAELNMPTLFDLLSIEDEAQISCGNSGIAQ